MTRIARIREWFVTPESWKEFALLVLGVLVFKLAWALIVLVSFSVLDLSSVATVAPSQVPEPDLTAEDVNELKKYAVVILAGLLTIMISEEFIFRFVPITIGLVLMRIWRPLGWLLIPIVLVASFVFGIIHVTNHDEITKQVVASSILLQGLGGVIYSVMFHKVAQMRLRRVFHGFLATSLTHILWNSLSVGVGLALAALLPQ